jgi:hypothetical protein
MRDAVDMVRVLNDRQRARAELVDALWSLELYMVGEPDEVCLALQECLDAIDRLERTSEAVGEHHRSL